MPLQKRVVEEKERGTRLRFTIESPPSSPFAGFSDIAKFASADIASASRVEYEETGLRTELREAQATMVEGHVNLAYRQCINLINARNLLIDLKVETIQLMATIVPLNQGLLYLEDAIRIADNKITEEPQSLLWMGLVNTTRDMLLQIHRLQGTIKLHREITFGDSNAATHGRDLKKTRLPVLKKKVSFADEVTLTQGGGSPVKKVLKKKMSFTDEVAKTQGGGDTVKRVVDMQEDIAEMNMCFPSRPLRTSSRAETLCRPLHLRRGGRPLLILDNSSYPKFPCAPFLGHEALVEWSNAQIDDGWIEGGLPMVL